MNWIPGLPYFMGRVVENDAEIAMWARAVTNDDLGKWNWELAGAAEFCIHSTAKTKRKQ